MKQTCIILLGIFALIVVAGGFFWFQQKREAKAPVTEQNLQGQASANSSTTALEFFYYEIPELGMQISLPTQFKGHLSHVYRERSDQSWLTSKEVTKEQSDAGLERCISRGEKIKEVIFRYDEPFYFGDDERGYTELGTLIEVKGMDSDDCGYGKIPGSYFVKAVNEKLYKYTSVWSWMGNFTMNQEKEAELTPLFFVLDANAGPSLRKIE